MKRFLSISFIVVATFTMIVSVVFPHHHHENIICLMTEFCDDDKDEVRDEHATHHHSDDLNHHNNGCVSESDFLLSLSQKESKYKDFFCSNCGYSHLFPVSYLVAYFLIYNDLPALKPEYGEFILSYKSIPAGHIHGLRAPPVFLS